MITAFLLFLMQVTISASTARTYPLLPNPKLSPGAINHSLTATLPADPHDKHNICSKSFRTGDYRRTSEALKKKVCAEYGVKNCPHEGTMEIDHIIPLETAGADVQENLWVQMAPYYHVKDILEGKLHQLVCMGKVPLPVAQQEIAHDWVAAYEKYIGPLPTK